MMKGEKCRKTLRSCAKHLSTLCIISLLCFMPYQLSLRLAEASEQTGEKTPEVHESSGTWEVPIFFYNDRFDDYQIRRLEAGIAIAARITSNATLIPYSDQARGSVVAAAIATLGYFIPFISFQDKVIGSVSIGETVVGHLRNSNISEAVEEVTHWYLPGKATSTGAQLGLLGATKICNLIPLPGRAAPVIKGLSMFFSAYLANRVYKKFGEPCIDKFLFKKERFND